LSRRVIKSLAIAFTVLLAGNCHCNQRGFRDYLSSVESEGSNPGEGEGMELLISENEEKLN
jgi:hypothetical protein